MLGTRHIAQLFYLVTFVITMCTSVYVYDVCVCVRMYPCPCVRVCVSVVYVEVKKQLEKLVLAVYLCAGPGHQTQVSRLTQPAALSAEPSV